MRKMSIAVASVCLVSAAAMMAAPANASSHGSKYVTKSIAGTHTFYNQDVAGDRYSVKAQQSFKIKVKGPRLAERVSGYDTKIVVKSTDKLTVTVEAGKPDVSVAKCKVVSGKKCTRVVVDLTGKAVTSFGTVYHEDGQLVTEVAQNGATATWGSLGPISKDA